jgi:hypothetical protein
MIARRFLALAILLSSLAACGLLIGVQELGVDPSDASPAPVDVVQSAPDVSVPPQPPVEAGGIDATLPDGAPAFRRVFLTSAPTKTTGMFNGAAAGDLLCQTTAKAAMLDGVWIAWLSENGRNAIERLTWNGKFELLDGTPVVDDTTKLVSVGPKHEINVTEDGKTVSDPNPWVWTGTRGNGLAANVTCGSWTHSDGTTLGIAGSFDTTTKWTDNGGEPFLGGFRCGTMARLYCFEQR